jgi:hypothetical protein
VTVPMHCGFRELTGLARLTRPMWTKPAAYVMMAVVKAVDITGATGVTTIRGLLLGLDGPDDDMARSRPTRSG